MNLPARAKATELLIQTIEHRRLDLIETKLNL